MAVGGNAVQVDFLLGGVLDQNGNPLAGGKVYTYLAGTSTAQALYTDAAKTTPATNPVILDAYGRAVVYGNLAYKFVVKDASDATICTLDNLAYNFWKEDNDGSGSGLDADKLDTYHAGNNSGQIPISNGTVCTTLNADKHDGYEAGNASGNIPVSNGTLNTNLNAEKLNGYTSGALGAVTSIKDYVDAQIVAGSWASDAEDHTSRNLATSGAWTDLPGTASLLVPSASIKTGTKAIINFSATVESDGNNDTVQIRVDIDGSAHGDQGASVPATAGYFSCIAGNVNHALASGSDRTIKLQYYKTGATAVTVEMSSLSVSLIVQ